MNGYLLFIFHEILDRDALVQYWLGLDAAIEGHAEEVISYGAIDRLEGTGDVEAVHLLRFPSFDAAKAWYQSDAYQALRPLVQKGARYFSAVLDGGRWTDAKDRMPHTIGRTRKAA
ncbi:DUF1330 domain-containing protein [Sphingobium fuliginis]|uniref:DUF1330 domain-containing protein n=1 Tax=Sphingobium fuliginis (strain ATCC 27551) TaxID=336203 RepID=A0A292ZH50_SPHSA|nr:DUF1330 domain-containing protein [Sphingobium fuliginis]GAY22169.1 hypothetical protein SFOMI_2724 [Sphingobium fuliginis]